VCTVNHLVPGHPNVLVQDSLSKRNLKRYRSCQRLGQLVIGSLHVALMSKRCGKWEQIQISVVRKEFVVVHVRGRLKHTRDRSEEE